MKRDRKSSSLTSVPPRMDAYSLKKGNGAKRSSAFRADKGFEVDIDGNIDDADSDSDELVQLLALQSYHLPGNSWCQDWWQFMANNHPVFGICCHNKVHPIKSFTRIVALIGTVTFGLALTNLFYVFFLYNPEYDRVIASMVTENGKEYVLTTGMLLLWTVGGGVHCMFNLAMWHIAACACCQSGGFCESCACCPSLGKYMIRFFIICTAVFSAIVIIIRVSMNDEEQKDIYELDLNVENVSEFSFVFNYLVEMTLSFFVYYPIGVTVLFSGCLACGKNIPVIGGRPYELACEERRNSRRGSATNV